MHVALPKGSTPAGSRQRRRQNVTSRSEAIWYGLRPGLINWLVMNHPAFQPLTAVHTCTEGDPNAFAASNGTWCRIM